MPSSIDKGYINRSYPPVMHVYATILFIKLYYTELFANQTSGRRIEITFSVFAYDGDHRIVTGSLHLRIYDIRLHKVFADKPPVVIVNADMPSVKRRVI